MLALEDGEWDKARGYFDQVLNSDAECSDAYVGFLMAELKVHQREDLANQAQPFNGRNNFKKAVRFGDNKTKTELNGYITHIVERNKDKSYDDAVVAMNAAKTEVAYKAAAEMFRTIPGWRNADALAKQCLEEADNARKNAIYNRAVNTLKNANSANEFNTAAYSFQSIPGWKDADALAKQCFEKAEKSRNDSLFDHAVKLMDSAESEKDYQLAAEAFEKIPGWKNSDSLAAECKSKSKTITNEKEYQQACLKVENAITEQDFLAGIEKLKELGDYKDSSKIVSDNSKGWESRQERAMNIWAEYNAALDERSETKNDIQIIEKAVENLNKEINGIQELQQSIRTKSKEVVDLDIKLNETQKQLLQAKKDLSSLGVFAFSQKRELSGRISKLSDLSTDYSNRIAQAKKFINESGSLESLSMSIESKKGLIGKYNKELEVLYAKLPSFDTRIEQVKKKIENSQVIAILAQDDIILPALVEIDSVVKIIKLDDELRNLIKSSSVFYVIPKYLQESIFGDVSFDVEAVYYQACQALENAISMDDIKWAHDEFLSIRRYKDSNALLAKCEKMIANNTFK